MAHRQSHGTIHSEAREIIANIVEKCDEEKLRKHLLLPLPKATERAAVYAGVSYITVKNIYIQEKRVPPIPKLLPIIKSKINFPWGKTSLRSY
jgi:hypothetical protein